MTPANQRTNIAIETERGDEALESAEILLGAGKHADSVSRAYYAAFQYARAILLTLGEEPITHAGVERMLHRDLVRTGALDADVARLFGRLQKTRIDADYTSEIVFTAAAAASDVDAARRFIDVARALLLAGGWRR